ncbi:hypothetical protein ARMGADRAFT_200422 [Armillaria gallica]|uniref:Smr domain-containing protein n=1 Tax=Armillaria gallica TaxID=47427 RepID=A0A2H3D846_ARMGA|nr:hypothetical protein ARMGADRAFT_200422 [Armillaria gallica]
MDTIFTAIAGLGIRFALQFTSGSQRSRIGPMLLGFWEGVCVHYSANASPDPRVSYVGYLLRIALDLLLSDNIVSVFLTILWTILGVLFSEALGTHHGHDTTHERKSSGSRRTVYTEYTAPITSPVRRFPRAEVRPGPVRPVIDRIIDTTRSEDKASDVTISVPVTASSIEPSRPSAPSSQLPTPPATLLYEVGDRQIPLPPNPTSSSAAPHDQGAVDHPAQNEEASDRLESPIKDLPPRIIIPPPPQSLSSPNILSAMPVEVPFSSSRLNHLIIPPPMLLQCESSDNESLPSGPDSDAIPVLLRTEGDTGVGSNDDPLQTPVGFHTGEGVGGSVDDDPLMTPVHLRHAPALLLLDQENEESLRQDPLLIQGSSTSVGVVTAHPEPLATIDEPIPVENLDAIPVPAPATVLQRTTTLPEDNSSASSSPPSITSAITSPDSPMLSSRAEALRKQAWSYEMTRKNLRTRLNKAIQQQDRAQEFILKQEIDDCNRKIDKLHERAARRHYHSRNRSLQANPIPTIDLHGLLTAEAVIKTEKAFKAVLEEGGKSLRVIVGKGLHSKQRKAKLKPAVEKAMISHGITCTEDKHNTGILIISTPATWKI